MITLNPKFIRNCANVSRSSRGLPSKDSACLIVKETPNKDAVTTTSLAIMSGHLMKKNEQGAWQKRYCAIVPHLFLYYYENDTSENPRGIIDLEFYTRIHIDNENHLILSPASNIPIRSFYFHSKDSENPQVVEEWMTKLQRDRYDVIKDERDAYKQLQDEYTGEMNVTSKLIESKTDENNQLQNELEIFRSQYNAILDTLEFVLNKLKDFDEIIHHMNVIHSYNYNYPPNNNNNNNNNKHSSTNHKVASKFLPVENNSYHPPVLSANLRHQLLLLPEEEEEMTSYRNQIEKNVTTTTECWKKKLQDIEQSTHDVITSERQLVEDLEIERQRVHQKEHTIQELMKELQRVQSSHLMVLQTHRETHQKYRAEKKILVQEVKSLRTQLESKKLSPQSSQSQLQIPWRKDNNRMDDTVLMKMHPMPVGVESTPDPKVAATVPSAEKQNACNGSDNECCSLPGSLNGHVSSGKDDIGNVHDQGNTTTVTRTTSNTSESIQRLSSAGGIMSPAVAIPVDTLRISNNTVTAATIAAATTASDNISIKSSSTTECMSDMAVDPPLPITPSLSNRIEDHKISFIPSDLLSSTSTSTSTSTTSTSSSTSTTSTYYSTSTSSSTSTTSTSTSTSSSTSTTSTSTTSTSTTSTSTTSSSTSSTSSSLSLQLLSIFHKPSFLPVTFGGSTTSTSPSSPSPPPNTTRHHSMDTSSNPTHVHGYLHHDTAATLGSSTAPRSYSYDSPPIPIPMNLSATAIKTRCLRCGGTLEGPKHSTCHCESPVVSDSNHLSTPPLTLTSPSPLKGIGLGAYFNQLFVKENNNNNNSSSSASSVGSTIASDNRDTRKDVQMKEVIKFSNSNPIDTAAILTLNQITS